MLAAAGGARLAGMYVFDRAVAKDESNDCFSLFVKSLLREFNRNLTFPKDSREVPTARTKHRPTAHSLDYGYLRDRSLAGNAPSWR